MTKPNWYAIRTTPSAQRMARPVPDLPEDQQHRRGETIIERNLRNAGIDVFMPAFWKEIRQHRSRKLTERRFPLLVGYAFIRHDPGHGFDCIRSIDGVNGVLRISAERGPQPFVEADLTAITMAVFDKHQAYQLQRQTALEGARYRRKADLHADLGRLLPKGRSRTTSLRYHADACIKSLSDPVRVKVLGIIETLDRLTDDATLDEFREAV